MSVQRPTFLFDVCFFTSEISSLHFGLESCTKTFNGEFPSCLPSGKFKKLTVAQALPAVHV